MEIPAGEVINMIPASAEEVFPVRARAETPIRAAVDIMMQTMIMVNRNGHPAGAVSEAGVYQ
jgi:hypothetical protein